MRKIRIVGVPEHFNMPWHMAIEEGAFKDRGIELEWIDVPEGSGKMCEMLRDGRTDLGIILTEGIIKSIAEGNPARIVQQYVSSPLLWGIHVASGSNYQQVAELEGKRVAISRPGSGSHLMAYLHARKQGWQMSPDSLEIVNNVEGAVHALSNGNTDYFMWEHFTTKPLVDQGVFRRLGDFPTPWPCFVVVASLPLLKSKPELVRHLLEVINTYTADFRQIPSIDRSLANKYGQQAEDIREWLAITRWSNELITNEIIDIVQDSLIKIKLLFKKLPSDYYVFNLQE